MFSLFGVWLSFLAMLPSILLTPAAYDLSDPNLFDPDAMGPVDSIDPMNEPLTLTADTSLLGDVSLLDMPGNSGSLDASSGLLDISSGALNGLVLDSDDSSIFADPASVYISSSCISPAPALIPVEKSKARRENKKACPNPGTTGNAPTDGQKDKPPLRFPNPEDLPSLVDPLVLPAIPPKDETKCPPRFPARLCCLGPPSALEKGFYFVSVANCVRCK